MDGFFYLGLLTIWLIHGILGALLAEHRGRDRFAGFWAGFLFGILGLTVVALLKKRTEPLQAAGNGMNPAQIFVYGEIPREVRDALDTVYVPAIVVTWWTTPRRDGESARDVWASGPEGREWVLQQIDLLTSGAFE